MTQKTDFFTNNEDINTNTNTNATSLAYWSSFEILENHQGIADSALYDTFNTLIELQNLVKIILDANTKEARQKLYDEDGVDAYEGMTAGDISACYYFESLMDFDLQRISEIADKLYLNIICPINFTTEHFFGSLKSLADDLGRLYDYLSSGEEFNFDTDFREDIESAYYIVNYSLLVSYKLLYFEDKEVCSGIKFYCDLKNITLEDLVTPMVKLFNEHKPNICYLLEHTELFEELRKYIPFSILMDLAGYSNFVTTDEWKKMLPDAKGDIELVIDDIYFDTLIERYQEYVIENGVQYADDDEVNA